MRDKDLVDIDDLLFRERERSGVRFPVVLRTHNYFFLDGHSYEWVHKLVDVRDDVPLYTTGLEDLAR